ncbi:MAG: GTP-binding protein Era [Nitriliruptoraceae bacterium]
MSRPLDLEALLADLNDPTPDGFRSGMIALVGRPNVGKSTLLNAMVGEKIAIVTDVPGTTRNAIRGVVERPNAQLVFLDTPGMMKPRTLLSKRLNEMVEKTWRGVDLICFMIDAADGLGTGDQFLAERIASSGTPVIAIANKEDLVSKKHGLLPQLTQLTEMLNPLEVIPTAAATGFNVERLMEVITEHLPEGPRLLPKGTVTDQAETHLVGELVREQFITRMKQELPHSIAVVVQGITPREDGKHYVEVVIHVERDSQKGIVIGKGGATIKEAGIAAREQIELLLGTEVHLDTRVKVTKEWQRDPKALGRFGY